LKALPEALADDVAAVTVPALIKGSVLFAFNLEGQDWQD